MENEDFFAWTMTQKGGRNQRAVECENPSMSSEAASPWNCRSSKPHENPSEASKPL